MEMVPFSTVRWLLFIIVTLVFLNLSWKALQNPRCHGFYRFFAFEGVLFLVLYNHPFWFTDVFSPQQIISWLLLVASILFVIQGQHLLRKIGGRRTRTEAPENLAFENTTALVTEGIYRYIRHPMYSSLLLLTWGAFLKHFSLPGFAVAVTTTIFLFVVGYIEEQENLAFFGQDYRAYQKTTKMFLPFAL